VTSRRRRWSADQKARIIEDRFPSSVGEASTRRGVSKSQLFNCRREARAVTGFAQIEVDDDGVPAAEGFDIHRGEALVRAARGANGGDDDHHGVAGEALISIGARVRVLVATNLSTSGR
jgi:transposase-like protein